MHVCLDIEDYGLCKCFRLLFIKIYNTYSNNNSKVIPSSINHFHCILNMAAHHGYVAM